MEKPCHHCNCNDPYDMNHEDCHYCDGTGYIKKPRKNKKQDLDKFDRRALRGNKKKLYSEFGAQW